MNGRRLNPRDGAAIADEAGRSYAVQFHPEKSAQAGLRLLGNFMRWNP